MTDESYLAMGFRDVDRNSDIGKLLACLRFMERLPSFALYKSRSIDLMNPEPGHTTVDLGCGLGFDVQRLAGLTGPAGLAIGVDNSNTLLRAAGRAHAGAEFIQSDIHQLPFESDSVDSIRVDRVLQHIEDPGKVISEMARVLKPGGRMVCAEPDWFTFVIDSDDLATTGKVIGRWRNSFRNPAIGRQLLRRIRQEGFRNTLMEGYILLADGLHAADIVYDLSATARMQENEDREDSRIFSLWLDSLVKRDRRLPVTASVTLFLASGQKP